MRCRSSLASRAEGASRPSPLCPQSAFAGFNRTVASSVGRVASIAFVLSSHCAGIRDPNTRSNALRASPNTVLEYVLQGREAGPAWHRDLRIMHGRVAIPAASPEGPQPLAALVPELVPMMIRPRVAGPASGQQVERDFAGGLKGSPIEVVKLARTGLQVPATAEVVIEGECLPGDVKKEGPFGEWTGYYASHVREEPLIRIRRMYFRNDPIMAGAPPIRPPTEATFYKSFWRSAMVWEELERAGVPDVVGVYCPPDGNTRLLTVVSIRQR